MSEQMIKTEQNLTVKSFFEKDEVKAKFQEMLGKRSTQFITSVIQIANSNELLKKADQVSLLNAAITSATLDLPINQNLGFAYIVPYNAKQQDGTYKQVAQFQMGYKGFIQLAQRSGQFKTISATPICEGQIISENPLTGFDFDFSIKGEKIIGYAAYFKLINGFEKTLYMTKEQLTKHGVKYSQTFKKGFGLWKDDFDGMALKTVLKLLLSKYAPLSVEMQRAVLSDQGVINDAETMDIEYSDNPPESIDLDKINFDKERNRILAQIEKCDTLEKLEEVELAPIEEYNVYPEIEQKKEFLKSKIKK